MDNAGLYLCHKCNVHHIRHSEAGIPLKKWVKSFCEKTGKKSRLWLKLSWNDPTPTSTRRKGKGGSAGPATRSGGKYSGEVHVSAQAT